MFQLHLVFPMLILPFSYSSKFGYFINFSLILIISFALIAVKLIFGQKVLALEISEIHSNEDLIYASNRYTAFPDQYLSLFIIGVMFGYFLRNRQNFDSFLRKRLIRLLVGIFCYSTTTLSLVWSQSFKSLGLKHNKLNINLWLISANILWSVGNLWLIYDITSKKCGKYQG